MYKLIIIIRTNIVLFIKSFRMFNNSINISIHLIEVLSEKINKNNQSFG